MPQNILVNGWLMVDLVYSLLIQFPSHNGCFKTLEKIQEHFLPHEAAFLHQDLHHRQDVTNLESITARCQHSQHILTLTLVSDVLWMKMKCTAHKMRGWESSSLCNWGENNRDHIKSLSPHCGKIFRTLVLLHFLRLLRHTATFQWGNHKIPWSRRSLWPW